jgi:hypothetical protein
MGDFVSSSADTILLMSVLPMRRRKMGVIGRAATLALLASGAGADAAEVAICSLVTKPANFDRQAVTFQGTATAVKKTTSRRGNDYTLFKLQGPRDCGTVDVFMWGHLGGALPAKSKIPSSLTLTTRAHRARS